MRRMIPSWTAVAAVSYIVERARLLTVAVHADALTVAKASVAASEQTGYAPLIARALVVQGRAEIVLNAGEATARTSFARALDLALRSGDDILAVEAYARLIFAVARYEGDTLDNWSTMEAIAARTGPLGRFGRTPSHSALQLQGCRAECGKRPRPGTCTAAASSRGIAARPRGFADPPARG